MKAKVYISAVAITLSGMLATSCSDFLDKEVDLTLQKDNVFGDYDNTRKFLANIYTYLPDAFYGYTTVDNQNGSRDNMTDNSVSYWSGHLYHAVHNDTYDATNHFFANYFYELDTKGIRACNQFIQNARPEVIGNADKGGDDNRLGDRWVAEARFIRALLTFDMASWFGAAPIFVTEDGEPYIMNSNDPMPDRRPFTEVIDWIVSECDAIKGSLPFRYSNEDENWGRVNGAAVLALKSRALLYKASPLNNPGGNADWWQAAANAADEFITANSALGSHAYVLYTTADNNPDKNYYECFVSNPVLNNEYILSRSVWTTNAIEWSCSPCGFGGTSKAYGRTNPTQNLVDCYETKNGLPIDEDNTYDEQHPYANRDPRLEQTIIHHGTLWGDKTNDEERPVDVCLTGADYAELHGGTTTGYYPKKFVNVMSFKNATNFRHACPIFRYAEILLNGAEAWNEAGNQQKAMSYVNQVRARVGMPAYSGLSKERLRERIQNERRIELCFEDHRFFDVRRWNLYANQTQAGEQNLPRYKQIYNIYGVLPSEAPQADGSFSGTYTYRRSIVDPTLSFTYPKNSVFPIPNDEIKRVPNWKQNEGWEISSSSNAGTEE